MGAGEVDGFGNGMGDLGNAIGMSGMGNRMGGVGAGSSESWPQVAAGEGEDDLSGGGTIVAELDAPISG